MTKNIYQLQQRVKTEIANNVIRPENTTGQETSDVLDQNEADQEQHDRFKELISDFNSDRFTRDTYGNFNKSFDPAQDKPEQEKKFHTNLVNKVMTNNVIEPEDTSTKGFKTAVKKTKPQNQDGSIVEEMLLLQLDEAKQKKTFEKMSNLLGITMTQYLATVHFEKYYKQQQNLGLNQIEKNQDIKVAKELFACWDRSRLGHISIETMAENLISFGLAMSKDQVVKLIVLLTTSKKQRTSKSQKLAVDQIEMRQFIKIFEKDKFSDKAISKIKEQCAANSEKNKQPRSLAIGDMNSRWDDTRSHMSCRSKASTSRYSRLGGARGSSVSLMQGSTYAHSMTTGNNMMMKNLREMEFNPSIYEQITVTKDWWKEINVNEDPILPIKPVVKFLVKKGMSLDNEQAEKDIQKILGKITEMEYEEFYRLFCKGIFRVALLDMISSIEKLAKDNESLPLSLKLGAYRRNLLLSGLDKESNGELKEKGRSILFALQKYKDEIDPKAFKNLDFDKFVQDPLGISSNLTDEERNKARMKKHEMTLKYQKITEQGEKYGLDVKKMEQDILYGQEEIEQ